MSAQPTAHNHLETDPPPQPAWQPLVIRFTGSGSEYFRIWVVNLLLVIVTLSLYLPFARARRLRYFHGNTLVDGHALGFHGQGKTMLRGHLLVLGFAGCYALAGYFSPLAAGVAGLALVLLWPALWQASLRFRLANTSWRGLRMRFDGSVAGAYIAMLPVLLPGALVALLSGLGTTGNARNSGDNLAGDWANVLVGFSVLLMLGLSPWLLARIKRYQHGHYHFAGEATELSATARDFYRLWWRGGLVALVPFVALFAGVWLLMASGWGGSSGSDAAPGATRTQAIVWVVTLMVIFYGAMSLLVQPWFVARLQNLVWGRTVSPRLRFASHLRARDLAMLTLKNLLLTVLTLGLYRPFAVVANAKLRLRAVQLQSLGPAQSWLAGAPVRSGDAAGDAAGDLLGVDLGL